MAEIAQSWKAAKANELRQGLIDGFILLGVVDDMNAELGREYVEAAIRILEIADVTSDTFAEELYAAALAAANGGDAELTQYGERNQAAYEIAHDL